MKQTNERLCALAQKGDAAALDSLIDNNKSFIGKVANDLFRSMNLAQSGLNLDTDDLKQAGNLGLWKAVPKFDAARCFGKPLIPADSYADFAVCCIPHFKTCISR